MTLAAIASTRQVPQLHFGRGCVERLPASIDAGGRATVLFLSARSVRARTGELIARLKESGHEVHEIAGIPAEPGVDDFESVRAAASAIRPSVVVGIGGGSVLDVAKLVAALHDSDQRLSDALGIGKLSGRRSRLICVPTTAGAGSEASPNAVLLDRAARLKKAVISPHLVPDESFVDPSLCDSVPPDLTASTGLDALCHCVEAYVNRYATPLTDAWALEGIRRIGGALRRAVADGSDARARDDMSLGSLLGGLCLGPVNTTAVHALSYPIGGEFGVAHGLANAILLPAVATFNLGHAVSRYADVALALSVRRSTDDRATALAGIEAIRSLCADLLRSTRLSHWGVGEHDLERLARSALTVTRLLERNVREVSLGDAIDIYRSVL